jgi:hypothetical protein
MTKQDITERSSLKKTLVWVGCGVLAGAIFIGAGYWVGQMGHSSPTRNNPWAVSLARASSGRARLLKIESGPMGLMKLVFRDALTGKQYHAWGLPGKHHLVMLVGDIFDARGKDLTPHPGVTMGASTASAMRAIQKRGQVASMKRPPVTDAKNATRQSDHAGTARPNPYAKPLTPKAEHAPQSATQKKAQSARILWNGLGATHGFVTLNGKPTDASPVLQIFIDANCPFCHRLYQTVSTIKDAAIRWVPVAILKKSSLGRGAAVLKGGAKALAFNEDHFKSGTETGGIAPLEDDAARRLVSVNTMVLAAATEPVFVPAVAWRDREGVPHVRFGAMNKGEIKHILANASASTQG